MFAYCLFCRTQRCARIAQLLEIKGMKRAFSPLILQSQRVKGENKHIYRDFMPGYVFAFTEEKLTDYSVFFGIDGVIRKIGQADDWYELKGMDLVFAQDLLEKEGRVNGVRVVKTGDEVVLDDSLFSNRQARVIDIDYKKGRVKVVFSFRENVYPVWVAIDEVVERN